MYITKISLTQLIINDFDVVTGKPKYPFKTSTHNVLFLHMYTNTYRCGIMYIYIYMKLKFIHYINEPSC